MTGAPPSPRRRRRTRGASTSTAAAVTAAATAAALALLCDPSHADEEATDTVPFPAGGPTPHGAALARLCALQCHTGLGPDPESGRCEPLSWYYVFAHSDALLRGLGWMVDEAGAGRIGGSTLFAPADRFTEDPSSPVGGDDPAPCVDGATGPTANAQGAVTAALTLYRNSLGGSVMSSSEAVGLSVVGISHWLLGVCMDGGCSMMAAVDTTRGAFVVPADSGNGGGGGGGSGGGGGGGEGGGGDPAAAPTLIGTPILTRENVHGEALPVDMNADGLLTLGRAALADPTWFAADPPTVWSEELNATVTLRHGVPLPSADGDDDYELTGSPLHRSWRLGGATPSSAPPPPPPPPPPAAMKRAPVPNGPSSSPGPCVTCPTGPCCPRQRAGR